jgi:dipeptidyl aminopeptidase/acylaminoacyl peptidase
VGHSAGAYNVVQAALNPVFAADMQGVKAIAGMAGPYAFRPEDHDVLKAAFGSFAPAEETQPSAHVKAGVPPILMVHGADDDIVVPKAYRGFFETAKAAGAEIELKVHPGTNHISILGDLSRPFRYRSTTYADILAFFAKHP